MIDLTRYDKILNRLSYETSRMNETNAITDVITYQLEKTQTQLDELKGPKPKRPKRSINWIVPAWKWIAGTPDALDWDEVLRSQDASVTNNNLQYKVNSEIFKKTQELLQAVNGIATATNPILGRNNLAKASQEIEHKVATLNDDVNELIQACQMAKAGVVNSNLLNKEEINQLISEIEVLPYSNVIEAIEYSEPSIYTNGTLLLYVLSMPKVVQTWFNHLITRSILKDGHRVDLKYKTILMNKQQTYGIKDSCLHLATAMVCKQGSLDLLPEEEYLPRLLKGGQTSCRYITCMETTVEVLKEDTIFLENFNSSVWSAYNNILLLVIGNSSAHTRDLKEVQGKLARCKEQLAKCFIKLNCRVRIPPDSLSLICQSDLADSESKEEFIDAKSEASLEGKAREAIPTEVNSVRQIKDALRNRIKPDNSKVVAGKIASLHVTNNNYTEFAKRVEELSDALERSVIIQGMTQSKAHEMAVEQTVNVCRLNTRSDLVKSILSSTTFSDSKDVVAKMIVEQNNQVKERQVYNNNANNSRYSNNGSRHNGNHFNNNSNRSSNNNNRNSNSNNNSSRRLNSRNNANRVEELSDALERSVIIQGMTQSKAHEMAVEQTVNVCRLNTRSDLVKSILSSTTFSDSKDVVAKMIVEQNNQVKERQVYNNNANNSRYSNNGSRHNGNHFNNNSNRSSNNNNRNSNSNNNSSRRLNSRNNANVRALNAHAPQKRTLRAEELDN
ncbi:PREDICTED: SWI5-dependent HO expression protein 3-like [Rhagoletis zephyria]|uniref:SWI5-dependent HO expression protein 3-like n=1 Tax=Rhagoletis zephyria TaxID=28612 RepID=UPI0008118DC5|nr:PREDICTED: SWI5-dependent HO expression protein 3-like [Rhagoletis zephyria]